MTAQPQTVAASLFERLNHFAKKDKVPSITLARFRRDAEALKKVDALTAYTALGAIAALENQLQEVLTMDKALSVCQLDDARQLNIAIENCSHMMQLSNVARLNDAARRIRADNVVNPIAERIQQSGLPESILQDLAERIYRYLMHNKIRILQGKIYQEDDCFLVRLYVSGYADVTQLAALQDEIYEIQSQCEQEAEIDLSAISFVLRPAS